VSDVANDVVAVVVDYHADQILVDCVESLLRNELRHVIVVENGEVGSVPSTLLEHGVIVVSPGVNLGYGGGVNRGVAIATPSEFILVSNPDLVVHDHAVAALVTYLEEHADVALVGPEIRRPDGTVYPSRRDFPNVLLAGLHAVLEPLWANNPATARYRSTKGEGVVDWVSGACFLVRRDAFEAVGGFDERYFMFAEEMALCWSMRERGYLVAGTNAAVVTHLEGVSRARAPRAMLIAHHRSALRFEFQTARGWRRALLPLATVVLSVRLGLELVARPRA
jgi:N-acetylglucosaminyl-diphospho-decaprenol L-rhamnosyltransferase